MRMIMHVKMHIRIKHQEIGDDKHGKYYTCNPISRHKGKVDPTQIIGFHHSMLVNKHTHKDRHPYPVPPSKDSEKSRKDHAKGAQYVQHLGDPQGLGLTQPRRHGIKLLGFVKLLILQGINDIEAADPKDHSKRKKQRQQSKMPDNGQIGAYWGQRQTDPKHKMPERCEALGITI